MRPATADDAVNFVRNNKRETKNLPLIVYKKYLQKGFDKYGYRRCL